MRTRYVGKGEAKVGKAGNGREAGVWLKRWDATSENKVRRKLQIAHHLPSLREKTPARGP